MAHTRDAKPSGERRPASGPQPPTTGRNREPGWIFWLAIGLVAVSGCSALIYEIVWFQLLELVVGSSAISLGILLAIFMGGMCLGSMLLPRVVRGRLHPFRVYAWLEIGIGLLALLVL